MKNDPNIGKVGEAIRNLRLNAGISMSELANRLGWDKARLSKYENNRLGLTLSSIERIAAALGKHPEFVVFECLATKYPRLNDPKSAIGKLLQDLIVELDKH